MNESKFFEIHTDRVIKAFLDFDLGIITSLEDETVGVRIMLDDDCYEYFNEDFFALVSEKMDKIGVKFSKTHLIDMCIDYTIKAKELRIMQAGYKFALDNELNEDFVEIPSNLGNPFKVDSYYATNLTLVSSNEDKIREFKRFGLKELNIDKGKDLKEIDAESYMVAMYKAKDAGSGKIVEDTALFIEGMNVGANVRWLMNELGASVGKKATWQVNIGVNNGHSITVFQANVHGKMCKAKDGIKGFGFDLMFVPDGANKSLGELEQLGLKDLFSARRLAVENMLEGKSLFSVDAAAVPDWKGKYQN